MYRVKMVLCLVVLHLTLITLVASQASDFCSIMCQGEKSSTVCQNAIAQYEPKSKLAKLNFICCFSNSFILTNIDYFKNVTEEFKNAIVQEEDQEILYDYAVCVSRCSTPGTQLSIAECKQHTMDKYSKCRKTCFETGK